VILGTTEDLGAVTLNDEGEFHDVRWSTRV
jgi:hypothetical protein